MHIGGLVVQLLDTNLRGVMLRLSWWMRSEEKIYYQEVKNVNLAFRYVL